MTTTRNATRTPNIFMFMHREKKSRSRAVFLLETFAAVLVYVLGRLSKQDVDVSENVI